MIRLQKSQEMKNSVINQFYKPLFLLIYVTCLLIPATAKKTFCSRVYYQQKIV